jgi:DNA-binding CsgD family transcriptional regulator
LFTDSEIQKPMGITVLNRVCTVEASQSVFAAQIAGELYISEKTAGHHVSSVLSKLNVSNLGQAAAVAVANDWVGATSKS